jgi:hypothetical protein
MRVVVKKRRPSRTRRGMPAGSSGVLPAEPPQRRRWSEDLLVPLAVLSLIFGIPSVVLAYAEVRLDLDHRSAVARIEQLSAGNRSGYPEARVVFPVPGRSPVDADVDRALGGDTLRVGDSIRIEYSPSDPSNARRAGTHSIVCFPIALASVAYLAFVPQLRSNRARRRRGDSAGPG